MDIKNKKVLVTGASGFLGSRLCERLLGEGCDVAGLVFGASDSLLSLKENKSFKIIEGDIRDFDKILAIIKEYNPEVVFHTAALLPSEKENNNPFNFFEVNARGTLNLLEACKLLGVKKIVYSSTTSVYQRTKTCLRMDEKCSVDPSDFYEVTKLEGENLCRLYSKKYNMSVVVLRYSGVFGFGKNQGAVANFVKNALSAEPLVISGNISWDIVWVEDVVSANILAFKKIGKLNFEIFNIGSGKEINIKDLAKEIIKITGSNSKIETNISAPFFCRSISISKTKKILNFKPLSAKEALAEYVKEVRGK